MRRKVVTINLKTDPLINMMQSFLRDGTEEYIIRTITKTAIFKFPKKKKKVREHMRRWLKTHGED